MVYVLYIIFVFVCVRQTERQRNKWRWSGVLCMYLCIQGENRDGVHASESIFAAENVNLCECPNVPALDF